MVKKIFLMLLLAVGLIPVCGQNAITKRVAILEIVDKDEQISYGVKLMIRSNLAEAITATPGYEGYDRVDISSIMSEHNFQRTGLVSDADIKRLGEMTGAQYVLVTEVVRLDEQNLYIAAKILNVESARIDKAMNVQTTIDATDIQRMSKVMAKELFSNNNGVFFQGAYRKVAILEIVDRANEISKGIKFMIRSNLAKTITATPGYEGYDRVDISSIMHEHEFQRTGLVSDADIKRLGEMTGAQYILIAEVARISSEMLFLTAKILDVETAKIEKTANLQSGTSSTELQDASISLAKDLFGWQASKGENGYVFTDDMSASDLGANAIMMFNEGNYTEAIELFKLAIEKGDWYHYRQLGSTYQFLKEYSKAIECYDEYLKYEISQNVLKYRLYCDIAEFNLLNEWGAINKLNVLNRINSLKKYVNDSPKVKETIGDYYLYLFRNDWLKEQDTDAIAAFNWYREAATQGDADAQYHLGLYYKYGYATKKNMGQYKYWMKKSAEQGFSKAIDELDKKD